jgi:phosphohistidine phosphatase
MTDPLQRRITLIRHAKAEDDGQTPDHLRALNARGREDATALGAWMRAQHVAPDLILCSTALRTRQTLEALALGNVATILTDKAYLASAGDLLALLHATDDTVRHVVLIAHNPGLHQLAATLVGSYADADDADRLIVKFPTSAYASYTVDVARWADVVLGGTALAQLRLAGAS